MWQFAVERESGAITLRHLARLRRYAIAIATFSVALLIGFIMQYGDAHAARVTPETGTVAENVRSAQTTANQGLLPVNAPDLAAGVSQQDFNASRATNFDCSIALATAPDEFGATVMSIISPCRANMDFALSHDDLVISATSDARGRARLALPQVAEKAGFVVRFEDGGTAQIIVN